MVNPFIDFVLINYVHALSESFANRKSIGLLASLVCYMIATPNMCYGQDVFSTKGLYFENVLTQFYQGNFLDIPFDRDDTKFVILYNAFLTANGMGCGDFLPSNKVEIMNQKCVSEEFTTNEYGIRTDSVCVKWVLVRTGLYADSKMYAAKLVLDELHAGKVFRDMSRHSYHNNTAKETKALLKNSRRAEQDMAALFLMNKCNGSGLQKLAKNFRLFASDDPSIKLAMEKEASGVVTAPMGEQDFRSFMEDLIEDQSNMWLSNKFIRGSIREVHSFRDNKDRPTELSALYSYNGFSGRSSGSVRLTFVNGIPNCMYFSDFLGTCKTPNKRIVQDYINGRYDR
ncbi:MAG: hypothetical protein ABJX94_05725 [Flavobacteriaceae bacterium]